MAEVLTILGILVALVLVGMLAAYNGVADLRQDVRTAWRAMDEALRQRYDRLPALVAAVRNAGSPDDRVGAALAAATAAKNNAAVAFSPEQLAAAEAKLSVALSDLFSHATARPELTGDPAFQKARTEMLASDAEITKARLAYNDAVVTYNSAVRSFPYDVVATAAGLKQQVTFDLPTTA